MSYEFKRHCALPFTTVICVLASIGVVVILLSSCGTDRSCDGGGCTTTTTTVQGDNVTGDGTVGNPQSPPIIITPTVVPTVVPVIVQ